MDLEVMEEHPRGFYRRLWHVRLSDAPGVVGEIYERADGTFICSRTDATDLHQTKGFLSAQLATMAIMKNIPPCAEKL